MGLGPRGTPATRLQKERVALPSRAEGILVCRGEGGSALAWWWKGIRDRRVSGSHRSGVGSRRRSRRHNHGGLDDCRRHDGPDRSIVGEPSGHARGRHLILEAMMGATRHGRGGQSGREDDPSRPHHRGGLLSVCGVPSRSQKKAAGPTSQSQKSKRERILTSVRGTNQARRLGCSLGIGRLA